MFHQFADQSKGSVSKKNAVKIAQYHNGFWWTVESWQKLDGWINCGRFNFSDLLDKFVCWLDNCYEVRFASQGVKGWVSDWWQGHADLFNLSLRGFLSHQCQGGLTSLPHLQWLQVQWDATLLASHGLTMPGWVFKSCSSSSSCQQ